MEELREIRIEQLKRLYSDLEYSHDDEEKETILKEIRVLEDAIKTDLEVSAKLYDIDIKHEIADQQREQELVISEDQRKMDDSNNKKNRIIEGVKIGVTVAGTIISTVTSMKLASWIIEVEKTGTIRSKAFDLVRKGMK